MTKSAKNGRKETRKVFQKTMTSIKDSVFLPHTDFPMRGNLSQKEPEILQKWQSTDLYGQLRKLRKGREKFILHEGPPFANGHIHIGHALNRILKDLIVRTQSMLGKDAPVIPGWDCHGLPIEWKIEEKYREQGKNKEDVDIHVFRQECYEFAQSWIHIQSEELQRLGVLQDWANPYITMNPESEAIILEVLGKFLMDGSLYRGFRPVMWSVVEKTALAEAEIEYQDHTSPSIYVGFPIVKSPLASAVGTKVVIWTTTPWTLPANRAIAYHDDVTYVLVEPQEVGAESLVKTGDCFWIAENLLSECLKAFQVGRYILKEKVKGSEFQGTICAHPWRGKGYDFDVPLLPADYVSTDTGTGFVHTAPSHGPDDFILGQKYKLEVPDLVAEDGVYKERTPLFAGKHIFKVDKEIIESLRVQGGLLCVGKIVHSYPHSWRSKAPVIYRTTPQWFISMDHTGLRDKALRAIDNVQWIPPAGQRRLSSMIEQRPDWCVSRQRMWGVPLTLFVNKITGDVLRDEKVHQRIVELVRKNGCAVWYQIDPKEILLPEYNPDEFEPVKDIIDVWFESGSTQSFVLEQLPDQKWPADIYVEGSDQHRGWFQSSLFIGCQTRGNAPYKTVITHGFTLDDKGQKMSKSLGNVVSPLDVANSIGVDILRLWVANSDVHNDIRIGPETLKHQQDIYRRFRNTLRYLLGALKGYQPPSDIHIKSFPILEQWMLDRLYELNKQFQERAEKFDYLGLYNSIHNFCAIDLSSFYFDIRKDVLYCDDLHSVKRQATLYVMHHIFDNLVRWLAPVLCFTAEEAWSHYYGDSDSVHLQELQVLPDLWENLQLRAFFETTRAYRRIITGALEQARNNGQVGSSLQAHVEIFDPTGLLDDERLWEELSIVSQVTISRQDVPQTAYILPEMQQVGVIVHKVVGEKCERCWKVTTEVGQNAQFPTTCHRCSGVLAHD